MKVAENPGIMVLTGTPGSCKNALIKAYASQFWHKLTKYSETNTLHVDELYGSRTTVLGGRTWYPLDLETLITFIRKHTFAAASASVQKRPLMSSGFCSSGFSRPKVQVKQSQNSHDPTKSQESIKPIEQQICLIQGLPECLKIVSSVRAQLLKDFNDALTTFLNLVDENARKGQTRKHPLIIFTFSDPSERHQAFVNRVFSQHV